MTNAKQLSPIASTVPTNAIGSHYDDRIASPSNSKGKPMMKTTSEPITLTNGDSVMQTAPEVPKAIEDESPVYEQKSDLADPSVGSSDDDLDDEDLDDDVWDDKQELCPFCNPEKTGSGLPKFIRAILFRSYFDHDDGNIVTVRYVRRFVNDSGDILAIGYAYFRVFHQRKQIARENGQEGYANVFWALKDDVKFALDGKPFQPQDGDEVSDLHGRDWGKVFVAETCQGCEACYEVTIDGCPGFLASSVCSEEEFVKFFTD